MKPFIFLIINCFIIFTLQAKSTGYILQSPDKQISIEINCSPNLSYNVSCNNIKILDNTSISLDIKNMPAFGKMSKVSEVKRFSNASVIATPIYKKNEIKDIYNAVLISFKEDFAIEFRAYNDGIAYRFKSLLNKEIKVKNEESSFNFPEDYKCYVPYVRDTIGEEKFPFSNQFKHSFENTYKYKNLTEFESKRIAFLPILLETSHGIKLCITEADLESYPGMYVNNPNNGTQLHSVFAPYPKHSHDGGHDNLQNVVDEYEDFIAKAGPKKSFPWRIIVIAAQDKELANNDMVYRLASPSRIGDETWIKPGKVAWDWWNDWGIYNVDFTAGVNQQTYKYYIDFASKNKIEYVILDDGWNGKIKTDLMYVTPELNMPELVAYAASKGVGIILWGGFRSFDKNMENICKHYSDMGVKGFKIDFMDRDDQTIVEFIYHAAEVAAKYHLLLDFHGMYKPTGIQRTFPNVINFEGVHGLEQMKWSDINVDQVTYDVTMPFIRMVAGPVDYTQGAMHNAVKEQYRAIRSQPMSQGTRCHQLAEYIVFESPLNMLCDSPTNYENENESLKFIAGIPTVWDETIILDAKISEYVVTARRKGNIWYIGGMTNWDKRELKLDLSKLGIGNSDIELYKDGMNAEKFGNDYKKEILKLDANNILSIKMSSGGGFAAKIINN